MLTISEKNMNSCPERSDTVPGSRFFFGKEFRGNYFIGLVQSVFIKAALSGSPAVHAGTPYVYAPKSVRLQGL